MGEEDKREITRGMGWRRDEEEKEEEEEEEEDRKDMACN